MMLAIQIKHLSYDLSNKVCGVVQNQSVQGYEVIND